MKSKTKILPILTAALGMLAIILDSRCAAQSVRDSLGLCLKTVIPSLFPMFVLSGLLVSNLSGQKVPFLNKIGQFCNIPAGCEGLLLVGALGGFPTGAVCIAQSTGQGFLSRRDAERILGFCNLCGPAFLFGIVAQAFDSPAAALVLFLIQIETALIVAHLWPGEPERSGRTAENALSLPQAVSNACRSMMTVCAWIILAGVLAGFLERWLFPFLPEIYAVLLTGLLELTSGCMALNQIQNSDLRFLFCSGMVCFGGISVLLQIQGAVSSHGISVRICAAQKLIQALLALGISAAFLRFGWLSLALPVPLAYLLKKAVEKPGFLMYNRSSKGGI